MGNWIKDSLDSICDVVKGEQLDKIDLEKSGEFPCVNGGIEPSGYTDKWNRLENTITISEGGNSCGFINYLRVRFWSGGHCYSLLNVKESFDTDFIYYALKGEESKIMSLRVGSGLPNIQQKAIKSFEIKYPEDKPEQTRIAEILSTADEAIANNEALIAKYQRIKTGLMQDLLTRGIDEHGNIRSKETHKFVAKNGIEVPEEWAFKVLDDMVVNPICYGIVQVGKFTFAGIKTIAIKDLLTDYKGVHLTDESIENKYIRSRVEPGDLLISIKATTGRIDIVPDGFEGNISRDIAKIRLSKEYHPKFYKYFFQSHAGKRILDTITVGTTRKEISIEPLKKIQIPILTYGEQLKIIDALQSIDNSLNTQIIEMRKLNSLKTGLMQDLLSGRVRVIVE